MLFKSRRRLTLREKIRLIVWPRVSWSRSARYVVKRLLRVKASPHKIAVGCAAGVFASITPLIGVQMVMAGAIALILRGSVAAAMLATFLGNPVSWPLIWGATYALGSAMIGQPGSAEAADLTRGGQTIWPVIYTMLVGSIPIGLASAAVSYGVVSRAVEAVQAQRAATAGAAVRLWAMPEPVWRLW
jgi:uncharacterized protein